MTPQEYEDQRIQFLEDFIRQVLARYLLPYLPALEEFFEENDGFQEVWAEIVRQIEEARRRELRAYTRCRVAPTVQDMETQTPNWKHPSTISAGTQTAWKRQKTSEAGCQTLPLTCAQQANQHHGTSGPYRDSASSSPDFIPLPELSPGERYRNIPPAEFPRCNIQRANLDTGYGTSNRYIDDRNLLPPGRPGVVMWSEDPRLNNNPEEEDWNMDDEPEFSYPRRDPREFERELPFKPPYLGRQPPRNEDWAQHRREPPIHRPDLRPAQPEVIDLETNDEEPEIVEVLANAGQPVAGTSRDYYPRARAHTPRPVDRNYFRYREFGQREPPVGREQPPHLHDHQGGNENHPEEVLPPPRFEVRNRWQPPVWRPREWNEPLSFHPHVQDGSTHRPEIEGCFICFCLGHSRAECPRLAEFDMELCYNCGLRGCTLRNCPFDREAYARGKRNPFGASQRRHYR